MTKISVKNLKGEKVKDITLNDGVWNIEVNDNCLKKMIRLQLDASRQGTRKTKNRSEVSGGGRKPWKQKGTGRARQGSIRATQWRGGGIPFGVCPRDFSFKINKKKELLLLKLH
jgi:50S ribosomal protein L4, bacterial/organelle